ncbi:AI-2E family transporter [Nonomuraea sp. NPDC001831]|uniref:AI-2E family transporter n=1 Tax=Nonomuraea sp. NPDC001831 TaxID=3364340 RepID=UPI0036C287DB
MGKFPERELTSGAPVAVGVATLVTLGAKGPIHALIFVGILIVEQQLENHVLQPLIVGRVLHFHPLAIIIVLAVGGILAGIAGGRSRGGPGGPPSSSRQCRT